MELIKQAKQSRLTNKEMVKLYTKQPTSLPEELRRLVKAEWGGDSIQLYAFVDLDANFELAEGWLLLGPRALAFAMKQKDGTWRLKNTLREEISKVTEIPGLSCNRLVFENKDLNEPLMAVRYTHRQSRAVGTIKFVIEQQTKKCPTAELEESVDADKIYTDNILHPVKEAQSAVAGNRLAVVWRLLSYLLPYKKQVALGMTGAFVMTLMALVPAALTGYIIDNVIKPFQAGKFTLDEAQQLATLIIAALVVTYAIREFFAWIRLKTMSVMGEHVAKDLRDQVYTHLHKLSLNYFSSKQTGSIISRVGSDTDRIWDFVAFGVVEVSTSLLMLTGLGIVLTTMDWPLGLMVTLPVPIILYAIAKHGEQMQNLFLRAWRKWSHMTDCVSDTIPGIRVVKAFNKEVQETLRFKSRNEELLDEFNRIHKTWTSFWPLLMLSIQAIVIGVWVFGVPRVLEHIQVFNTTGNSDMGLSPGTFVAFVMYLGMFVQPIEIIGQMARMVNRATSSAHRVFEVLDTEPQIVEAQDAIKLEPFKGQVEFQNVTFSYDGIRKIIKGISFNVKPGEMIGLVGPSGSGKTTIVNLLARFFDIDSGNILVDGVNLNSVELGSYRQQMGMVLQDPYLFHGSVLENIRYAKPEANIEEVIEAARAANAHDFVCRLSHSYDTVVGERGHTLSGGERQRISIARAILRNPSILILDEATSAVDTETERKIQQALDRLVSGRTVFAIAHRLSTLTKADRLFVIKEGNLVEQGTHHELLQIENGVYRKLVDMQKQLQSSTAI